jgi:glucan 1,3-beta-glucosidase
MRFHSLIMFLIGAASHVVAEPVPNRSLRSPPKATSATTSHNSSPKLAELISLASSLTADPDFATGEVSTPAPYWLEEIGHQGISAFNSDPDTYQVFRNVKSFGAKGV